MKPAARRALIVIAAVLAVASVAGAGELPRLPKDLTLPKGEDSPGEVIFRHDSHVDTKKPSCLGCHPRPFPMLRESALVRGAITHERMEKGEYCGACHGKGKS